MPNAPHRLAFRLLATDRAAVRAEVFGHWLQEKPGTATVRNTYRYDVETLSDGSAIYLTRPTRLNKGADFVVCCEGFTKYKNGKDRPPKHGDLDGALAALVATSPAHRVEILTAMRRIWECMDSAEVVSGLALFATNVAAERVLLLAKWLFIEQDVTYWTESGRHMLRGGLEHRFGAFP